MSAWIIASFFRLRSHRLRPRGRCGWLGLGSLLPVLLLAVGLAAQQPFPAPAVPAAQHPYNMLHVGLQVRPDFALRTLQVVEKLTISSRVSPLREVALDCDGPRIASVTAADGTRLQFHAGHGRLHVRMKHPLALGAEETITIRYQVTPKGGVVFFPGDVRHPRQATYLWVSGEPDTNRLWLPIYDHPNDKLTADFRITAPRGDWVIANGKLVGTRTLADGERVFHWAQELPISSYLLTFYIGRWTRVEASAGKTPLEYVTAPDETAAEARARFGRTPGMIAFYEKKLGVAYPWAKYAEVRNPGFFASLENASATEFPGDFPANADVPNILYQYQREDITLSHELAHQWFGDLVTCMHWSTLWVNEGMATFMQHQWDQHADGEDAAITGWERAAQGYFRTEGMNPHPIVWTKYGDPWNMFGTTTYNKGSWAVRTLEGQIGPEALWKGLHIYLTRYRLGNGDTARFEQAMESATGKNLQPFFQQWFYTAGNPDFEASWRWNANAGAAVIQLRQKNHSLYTGSMQVAAWVNGKRYNDSLNLNRKSELLIFHLPGRPQLVQVDPDHFWLKQLQWKDRSLAEWTYAAEHAPWSVDRIAALKELDLKLGRSHKAELAALLETRIRTDGSAAVRNAALRELAGVDPEAARGLALAALKAADAPTRIAGAGVLAELPAAPDSVPPLQAVFVHDPIAAVRAAALPALLQQNPKAAGGYLAAALKMKSYDWQVESAALTELGKYGSKALPQLLAWSTPSTPAAAREAALRALGRAGRGNAAALQNLLSALRGPLGPTQVVAALSLAELGDKAALPAIEYQRDTCWIGFFRGGFEAAMQELNHQ